MRVGKESVIGEQMVNGEDVRAKQNEKKHAG